MNPKLKIGLIIGGAVLILIVLGWFLGGDNSTSQSQPDISAPQAAATLGTIPGCVPVTAKRCQQPTQVAQPAFQFGQQAQPTEASSTNRVITGVKKIPIVGDFLGGLEVVWNTIRCIISSWPLLIVLALVMTFVFRMPIWMPFMIGWEALQTLWTPKTMSDVWGHHRGQFRHKEEKKE